MPTLRERRSAPTPIALLCAALGAATLGAAAPASADVLHVDPVGGDDASGDGSVGAPWQSLTHAVAQLPPGPNTIRLAPGALSESSGEVFPILVPAVEPLELLGDPAGGSRLRADQGLGDVRVNDPASPQPIGAGTVTIRDLTFENTRLQCAAATFGMTVELDRVAFVDVPTRALSASSLFNTGAFVIARHCRFERCAEGAFATGGASGTATVSLFDSVFVDCGIGAHADGFAPGPGGGTGTVRLTRCEVRGSGTGLQAYGDPSALATLSLFDTLVAENGVGFRGEGIATLELDRSTLAGNTVGVEATGSDPSLVWVIPWGSVIWGNGFDVDPVNVVFPSWSNLPFASTGAGMTQLDPLFVDAPAGDFHLRSDSPLIDIGDPAAAPTALFESDLDPRLIDGDFDGRVRIDKGYDEWNPARLELAGTPRLGGSVSFATTTPSTATYALLVAFAPDQVPFGAPGAILIDLSSAFVLSTGTTPGLDAVSIPSDPALGGLALYAQAYAATPGLAALTNRVDLNLTP